MNRVTDVNKALKAQGVENIRLRAGRGYYYFDGEALTWPSSSVYIYRASDMSVDEWLAEFKRLKDITATERTPSDKEWSKAESKATFTPRRCAECGQTGHTYKTCSKWLTKERHA